MLSGKKVVGRIVHNLGYGRYGVLYEGKTYNISEDDIIKPSEKREISRLAEDGIIVHSDFISVPKGYKKDKDLSQFRKPLIERLF